MFDAQSLILYLRGNIRFINRCLTRQLRLCLQLLHLNLMGLQQQSLDTQTVKGHVDLKTDPFRARRHLVLVYIYTEQNHSGRNPRSDQRMNSDPTNTGKHRTELHHLTFSLIESHLKFSYWTQTMYGGVNAPLEINLTT